MCIRDRGVTVSMVSIGRGPDTPWLQQMAELGNGRFHVTDQAANLPQIFTQETAAIQRTYLVAVSYTHLDVYKRQVPNFELGRVFLRDSKKTAEQWASDRVREQDGLGWKEWGGRLNQYFQHIELLFWPDVIIVGGGVSKKHEKFLPLIQVKAKLLPAAFRNEACLLYTSRCV